MKISYNWLKSHIEFDENIDQISKILTDTGLEVEGISKYESIRGGLKGIVVGKVLSCEKHPNADKLKVTTVDIGLDEVLQIVCGAPNVDKGQTVLVATIGTVLYDEKGDSFKIKKGKIRGEVSFGMICAEDELGLGDSHDGIMVLEDSLKAGQLASEVFKVEEDYTIEIGLTPNRCDAMSHFGVARDVKAYLEKEQKSYKLNQINVSGFKVDSSDISIKVKIDNNDKCRRYSGVLMSKIKVKESPKWLQNRLKSIGLEPINNVVDATNFVMHDLGQPLHAFDFDKILSNEIIVKTLPEKTRFVTLDDKTRELSNEDLMICDGDKPMCIAGVFGGMESGIGNDTTNIFIESAYFDAVSVRKTAKFHALNTDASFRFERGVDPNMVVISLKKVAVLIKEIANAEISSDVIDLYENPIKNHSLEIDFDYINRILGQDIGDESICKILESLDIKILEKLDSNLKLEIPAYRADVTRKADIVEEILRIYGYNNIDIPDKMSYSLSSNKNENHNIETSISKYLSSNGFNEIMMNSLTKKSYYKDDKSLVEILNPLSGDLSVMRQNLLFGGLEVVKSNINHRNTDLKLYEFGNIYSKQNSKYIENRILSLVVSGSQNSQIWNNPQKPVDFFYLKEFVSNIILKNTTKNISEQVFESEFLKGISLVVNDKIIANIGIVNNDILSDFAIKQSVFYADIYFDKIVKLNSKNQIKYKKINKFPSSRRDLSLLLDDNISFAQIQEIAIKTDKKLLKSVNLFDVYEGKNLPKGKKSYAVSFVFVDENKTLKDKAVDRVIGKIKDNILTELSAELR